MNTAVNIGEREIFHCVNTSSYTVFEFTETGWKQIAKIPYQTPFSIDIQDDWKAALDKAKKLLEQ